MIVYQLTPFEVAFSLTGLSCFTKVHVLCRHLVPFIREYLPKGEGLGTVSEQATESAHSRFRNVLEKAIEVMKTVKYIPNHLCMQLLESIL